MVASVVSGRSPFEVVQVFHDIPDIHGPDDLNRYLPGIGKALAPPMIAVWKQGQIEKTCWYHEARRILFHSFQIHHDPWKRPGG